MKTAREWGESIRRDMCKHGARKGQFCQWCCSDMFAEAQRGAAADMRERFKRLIEGHFKHQSSGCIADLYGELAALPLAAPTETHASDGDKK